jgi:hypothetical protein
MYNLQRVSAPKTTSSPCLLAEATPFSPPLQTSASFHRLDDWLRAAPLWLSRMARKPAPITIGAASGLRAYQPFDLKGGCPPLRLRHGELSKTKLARRPALPRLRADF